MSTIKVDKEELRGIIREAVKKKLASLTVREQSKNNKKELDEAKKRLKEALAILEGQKITAAGSILGGQRKDGEVSGAMASSTGSRKSMVVDSAAADELRFYIENDFEFREGRQKKAIEKNLALKMKKGQYDSALAPKIWMYLVDAAVQKYVREFGTGRDQVDSMFDKATRMHVAVKLAREFEEAVESGVKDLDELISAA